MKLFCLKHNGVMKELVNQQGWHKGCNPSCTHQMTLILFSKSVMKIIYNKNSCQNCNRNNK